jgi:cytochrome c oxidase accessory protein FixG
MAWFTGFTFVAYFTPAQTLVNNMMDFQLGSWETFWIIFYSFATYGNAGWMREQVCTYMCPYARFQSAMFDDNTLIVSYDKNRGEPRGSRKASEDYRAMGLGDCIDCTLCVQVCPTGIDIRDGLQYQCISCSSCIDACNDVMDKMGYAQGLIRFTTQNVIQGKPTRLLRPRIIVYGAVLAALITAFAITIISRVPVGLDVIRDRNQLYRETAGYLENVYTLKIINMDTAAHEYIIGTQGIAGLKLIINTDPVAVRSGQVYSLPVSVRTDEGALKERSTDIYFTVTAVDNPAIKAVERSKFLGPPD